MPVVTATIRIFLLDDTRELRHRVRSALSEFEDLTVVGEADDPVDGLPMIADLQPDVVVCDLSMPRMDGLEAIPHIAESSPDAGIVIFSGFLSAALGETALAVGADRYVEKSAPLTELAGAVRETARDRRAGVRPQPRAVPEPAELPPAPPALTEVASPPREPASQLVYAGALVSLAAGTGLSLLADLSPTTFLILFLGPVAAVGALAPVLAGVAFALVAAALFGFCAEAGAVPGWFAASAGMLVAGLVLSFGARRLLEWANRRVDQQELLAGELRRSNAELEHFAYVASHDLAAPLRSISSFTTLLARRFEGQLDPEAEKMVGFITGGTARMQRMIDDLLLFARAGRIDADPAPFALGELLDQVRADLAGEIGERDAQVTNGPLPTLVADAPRIGQVLQNLISNAIKFCPSDRTPEVRVDATRLAAGWRIDVRDNGIGIDPRHAPKVFGMFQRLHGDEEFPGTGIGLAICQRIVERHGGRIWVDSLEGEGSTFSFTLPDPA